MKNLLSIVFLFIAASVFAQDSPRNDWRIIYKQDSAGKGAGVLRLDSLKQFVRDGLEQSATPSFQQITNVGATTTLPITIGNATADGHALNRLTADARYLATGGTAANSLLLDGQNPSFYRNYSNLIGSPNLSLYWQKSGSLPVNSIGGYLEVLFKNNNLDRWAIYSYLNDETPSSGGSNFIIGAYNNDGTYRSSPFTILRETGRVLMPQGVDLQGGKLIGLGNASASTDAIPLGQADGRYFSASGIVPDAQLTANVAMRNAANTFSTTNTFNAATIINNKLELAVGTEATSSFTLDGTVPTKPINSSSTVTVTVTAGISGNPVIRLPIKGVGSVVIQSSGSETFLDDTTYTLAAQSKNTIITLYKDSSTNWHVSTTW